jgi:hypothetical protein
MEALTLVALRAITSTPLAALGRDLVPLGALIVVVVHPQVPAEHVGTAEG